MALMRLACLLALLSIQCYVSILAVVLKTANSSPWANEFESIELSCQIESISTTVPRIEWKKIKNGKTSYVYFENKISGDLVNRAKIREPATLVILNATRLDTASYRCEVTAPDDVKNFDEILISLAIRVKPVIPRCAVPTSVPVGKSAELTCVENEGFPKSQYQWFRNKEEIPREPKSSTKFFNSSYLLNSETGVLVSTGRNGRRDILGSQLMCDASSHEENLLYALSTVLHFAIHTQWPTLVTQPSQCPLNPVLAVKILHCPLKDRERAGHD